MHKSAANAMSAWLLVAADACDVAASNAADLPVRALSALVLLDNRGGRNVDWLHRRLGLTQSGAVRLVDRLETEGLVRRERLEGTRAVGLYVTGAGEARLRRGLRARRTAIEALLEPLTEGEQRHVIALIGKALRGAERRRDDADVACRLCDWGLCRPDCPVDASVCEESRAR